MDLRVTIGSEDFEAREAAIKKALSAMFNRRISAGTFTRIVARLQDDGRIDGLSIEEVISEIDGFQPLIGWRALKKFAAFITRAPLFLVFGVADATLCLCAHCET